LSKVVSPESFAFLDQNNQGMWPFISLGIGIIIYTYFISNLFEKITTANTWFSILNMLFGFILLPMIILGKNTFLGRFEFVKYFYPYYDLNLIVMKESMKSAGGDMLKGLINMPEED
jgi:hypothetical protein